MAESAARSPLSGNRFCGASQSAGRFYLRYCTTYIHLVSALLSYSVQHEEYSVHNSPYLLCIVSCLMQNIQAIVALLGKDISRIQPDSFNVIEEPIIHALFVVNMSMTLVIGQH